MGTRDYPLAGTTVLLVDDDATVRSLVAMTLAAEGCDVHTAADGARALEILRTGHGFQLLIIDADIPVIDGRLRVQNIRALPCSAPVMVLSGQGADTADHELEAQASLDKPVDPSALVQRVKELVGGNSTPASR